MSLKHNPNIIKYLDQVCAQIKCKEIHVPIKNEMVTHIEERIDEYVDNGMDTDEAISKAISQMGDPIAVGIQLHRTHKPKADWRLIILAAMFLGFGLFTLYTIQSHAILQHNIDVFYKTLVFTLMGLAVLAGVSISDYRKWQSLSIYIYVFTVIGWLLTLMFGPAFKGLPCLIIGPFSINIVSIIPYILIIAAAGILVNYDWDNTKTWLNSFLLFIIPIFLFLASPSISGMILFASAFVVMIYFSGAKLYQTISILAVPVIPGVLAIISQPYRLDRLTIFLNPQADPNGVGYLNIQISEAIRAAGYFGQGFNISSYAIPELHTDFVFTYIVFSFGWIAGMLILIATLALFAYLFKTVKHIKNEYGLLLIVGLSTILLTQIIWHILMNLGYLPITAMGLPFMSYGGSQLIIQMLAVGILLSVYRLKDIVLIMKNDA